MIVTHRSPLNTNRLARSRFMSEANATVKFATLPEYPGYRFGDDGSVWSCRPVGAKARYSNVSDTWRLLKLTKQGFGYPSFCISYKGHKRTVCVHAMILRAFVGPPGEGQECRHLNGDESDCRLSNLAWGSHTENMRDRIAHGTSWRFLPNVKRKLNPDMVREIRHLRSQGWTLAMLEAKFHTRATTLSKIVRRMLWAHVA